MSNTTTFEKSISYDRETHDFKATLDGNYIGHFNSYHEAEVALDQVAYDLLVDGQCATATELDAGSDVDAIAADTLEMRGEAPAQLAADALLLEADADTPCCAHFRYMAGHACDCLEMRGGTLGDLRRGADTRRPLGD